MRDVFHFVGVPFDPAVLNFETNRRYARTASYSQVVREALRSFAIPVSALFEAFETGDRYFEPLIDRLGYDVEAT